ncbi:MAG: hydroxylamine reductase [Spirochaetes bacterium]|nr:hydroxylamine reductase [Spirochaetota bacterium]MBU1081187.1 hydroxylamine reductase [Spirochaetota bacterium]
MFCYQCQEAIGNKGCAAAAGACGKKAATSELQDLLIHTLKGLGAWAVEASALGLPTGEADDAVTEGLFATITNANFDDAYFSRSIAAALRLRDSMRDSVNRSRSASGSKGCPACGTDEGVAGEKAALRSDAALWTAAPQDYASKAGSVGVLATLNEDVRSLRELLIYGAKGIAAYAHHAAVLGKRDASVFAFMHKALAATLDDALSAEELTALVLECGSAGVAAMALLDGANTGTYGKPEMTKVNIGVRGNPGIIVSGHDLRDLEMLLEQTRGTGVDVYTHGEMLPAHSYPAFKKYDNFVGNYGNAWWKQREEFEKFGGPILMTTNCIVPPPESYKARLFTSGVAGFPGCPHIDADAAGRKDFSAVIAAAKKSPAPVEIESGAILGGFAHDQVAALAGDVVAAIKSGAIRKFVVMAGCDGRAKGRDYYADFAAALPKDAVILTAGCAKYRYNKLDLGDAGGIPRVLDAGQCNDSYSLVVTALLLKEAFGLADVNELPIAFNVAWYEQKAVIVLLALLSLGFKDIRLGPTLPAFLSPAVAEVLVERFGIAGIRSVEEDLAAIAG